MQPSHKTTRRIFLFLFPFTLFLASGCQKNTTPVELTRPQLTLSAEAGVIEAWLTVTTEEAQGGEVVLTRDGTERLRFALPPVTNGAMAETTVVDTGLLPAHSYSYAARLVKEGQTAARSNSVQLTTMDTTSHNFNWEITEFGGVHGTSALYDVAIISPTDIWAVGEIHTAETDTFDSLGNWVSPYNAVHWDGSEWELRRITYDNSFWTIKSVFAFSANDIWFSAFVRWDGVNFIELPIPDILIGYGINKVWGTSSKDLYVVGTQGLIAHYDGSGWQRIESGTELPIQDIWGMVNPRSGSTELFMVASNIYLNEGKKLFQLKNGHFHTVPDSGLSWALGSVWFLSEFKYYIAGAGIYPKLKSQWNQPWQHYPPGVVTSYFTYRIRGTGLNDVVAAGAFGEIVHFNGSNWKNFYESTRLFNGAYFSVDIKGSIVVATGIENPRAVIAMGMRNRFH